MISEKPRRLSRDGRIGLLVGISLLLGLLAAWSMNAPIADEGFHSYQISRFIAGDFSLSDSITVLPAYHGVVAAVVSLTGSSDLGVQRLVSFLFASLAIIFFYRLARHATDKNAWHRTAQFVWLPIVFPFFFLVYTDVFALALVLIAAERAQAQSFKLAAVAFLIAIATRQTEVFWPLLLMAIGLHELYGRYPFRVAVHEFLRRYWSWMLALLAFAVYVIMQGSVSMGDLDKQQITLNPTNVFFMLMVFWLAQMPWQFGQVGKIYRMLWAHKLLLILPLALSWLYWELFSVDHQYNQPGLDFYLRNRWLNWTVETMLGKSIGCLLVNWAVLSLMVAPLRQKSWYWLYPMAAISVIFLPVIEQRYYIVPLTLWLLFRERESEPVEAINLTWCLALSAVFLFGISENAFFL